MRLTELSNLKIAVWGKGREGEALKRFFDEHGIKFDWLDGNNVDLSSFNVVFKSPGISLYLPIIQEAKEKGVQFLSGTNLYLMNNRPRLKRIAVTGTKGKSTTSSLIAHVLTGMGFKTGLGGNIGVPLISLWGKELDYLVAELSSYQCADLTEPSDMNVVVNLYPEHVDWHGSHEQYYNDKINLLRIRHSGQIAFLNAQNDLSMRYAQKMENVILFNNTEGIHIENGWFYDVSQKLFETSQITNLKGQHNLENICAVLSVVKALGLPLKGIETLLNSFQPLPHRLQTIAEIKGVCFVDDSISTTPETAVAALKAFEGRKIFLLVGGFERQQDYQILLEYVQKHPTIYLLTLPDTGERIYQEALNRKIKTQKCSSIADAVKQVQQQAVSGDVVLLSPGAPSYHLYHSFEERGEDFKQCIEKYFKLK